jgi:hypothetical protein
LPIIGIFGDGARSGVTAKRTAKRDSPGAQSVHDCIVAVHLRRPYSIRQADRVCSILHRRYEVRERKVTDGARGDGKLPVNDAQRYRMNAAECILAGERCGPAYRHIRPRGILAVIGTPAGGHGRTSGDLEQCRLCHVGGVKPTVFSIPPDLRRLVLPAPAGGGDFASVQRGCDSLMPLPACS